jgi:hypothetical protein
VLAVLSTMACYEDSPLSLEEEPMRAPWRRQVGAGPSVRKRAGIGTLRTRPSHRGGTDVPRKAYSVAFQLSSAYFCRRSLRVVGSWSRLFAEPAASAFSCSRSSRLWLDILADVPALAATSRALSPTGHRRRVRRTRKGPGKGGARTRVGRFGSLVGNKGCGALQR